MMTKVCEYEVKILKAVRGDDVSGIRWGAAMGEAVERLHGLGLISLFGGKYLLTDAGWQFLKDHKID